MNPTLTTTAKLPNPTLASNEEVADKFNRLAWHLEHQKASPYRAQAWRNAAKTIRVLERSVLETARHEGLDRLISYPAIGKGIAGALGSYARTGRLHLLDVLEGQYDPVELFACVNSIGRELGQRIHETLEISTLEELARACWDGRLDRVPGIGRHRLHDIRNDLDTLFQTRERALLPGSHPSPDPLLDLDREFRLRAQIGRVERFRYKPPPPEWKQVARDLARESEKVAFHAHFLELHRRPQGGKNSRLGHCILRKSRDPRAGNHCQPCDMREPEWLLHDPR